MDRIPKGAENVESFFRTQAMKHPNWNKVLEEIKMRFRYSDVLERIAVDATSARLEGVREREEISLSKLGEGGARDLKAFWEKYEIEQAEEREDHLST